MDRRDFIKLASLTGLGVGGAALLGRAWATDELTDGSSKPMYVDYEGPLFVMVQAVGGWDPTMFCDPKGNLSNLFNEGDELTAGTSIKYAPITGAAAFFSAHASKTMVLNGIDIATNSH